MSSFKYYVFNKPYNVLSQFTKDVPSHVTLSDFLKIEKDVYSIGRLDRDSEGILLFTNDGKFKKTILDPNAKKPKTYLVQVDGQVSADAIQELKNGVTIKLKSGPYTTLPCEASILADFSMPDRDPPIRIRKNIPTSWIEITIT